MKTFLILSTEEDTHARYVSWALEQAGYGVELVNSKHENCPSRTTLYLDDNAESFSSSEWIQAEAAWCRRLGLTLGWGQNSDDEDEKFVRSEERLLTSWLIGLQKTSVRWINYPIAEQAAENKFMQLKSAKTAGLKIPRTLVTTNPEHFRAFLKTEGTVVAKSLGPYAWELASGKTLTPFASILDLEKSNHLSNEDISRCVTIYQQYIEKVSDVRMLILGQDIFAYKVIQNGERHFDYRIGFYKDDHLSYELIAVPDRVQKGLMRFMDDLQINFASADFALTQDGEFVFLDLNPSGQWMFIESGLPSSGVGQRFCSFFVDGFVHPDAEKIFPSISEYKRSREAGKL